MKIKDQPRWLVVGFPDYDYEVTKHSTMESVNKVIDELMKEGADSIYICEILSIQEKLEPKENYKIVYKI